MDKSQHLSFQLLSEEQNCLTANWKWETQTKQLLSSPPLTYSLPEMNIREMSKHNKNVTKASCHNFILIVINY
jgi:hypothetical protein